MTASLRSSSVSLRIATRSASYSSLFYLPSPLAAALTRRSFQFFFGSVAVFLFSAAAVDISEALRNGVRNSRMLRFRVIQTRYFSPLPIAHVSNVGLMLNGAELHPLTTVDGSTINLEFAAPVSWNMWYFRTASHTPELDPVSFCLEEYDDYSSNWQIVSSSSHLLFMSTRTFFNGHYDTSINRDSVQLFDHRSNTGRFLQLLNPVMVSFFAGLSSLCGVIGTEEYGRRMLCAALLWCAASNFTTAAWYLLLGDRSDVVTGTYYAFGAVDHGFAFFLLACLQQERLQLFLACHGSFFLVWAWTLSGRPYDGPYSSEHWALALALPYTSIAVLIQLARWWIVNAAYRLVRDDRRRYDTVWAAVSVREPKGFKTLTEVEAEAEIAADGDMRQYRPRPVAADDSGEKSKDVPETCLVSLQAAALRVGPLLRDKVAKWSAATGGLHSIDPGDGGPPRLSPLPPPGSAERDRVIWAKPKTEARAAEKAVRVYAGDVSRLTDLARQV